MARSSFFGVLLFDLLGFDFSRCRLAALKQCGGRADTCPAQPFNAVA